MLVMSLHFFQHEVSGILTYKDVASSQVFRLCFKAHIFFGMVAIFTGPTQFLPGLRTAPFKFHRRMGYVYFSAVLTSAVMGLLIAQYAMGGLISTVGFSLLALFWLGSALAALVSIKRGAVTAHKQWMFISYGLTFTAIPQRTLMLLPLLMDLAFIPVYQTSAWLPWLLNTGVAWYLFRRSERR